MKLKNLKSNWCYEKLLNTVCFIALFFILMSNVFAEVPHTTVYENPSKDVTKVETMKRKPKGAELNISVTKVKSQEIEGIFNKNDKSIYLRIDELNVSDKIVITDVLNDVSNYNKLMLYKNKYNYDYYYPEIVIKGDNLNLNTKLYVIVFDSSNNLKFVKKLSSLKEEKLELMTVVDKTMKMSARSNAVIFEFKRDYMWNTDQVITGEHISELTKEVEISFMATSQPYGSHRGHNREAYGRTYVDVTDANGALIESKTFTWWTYLGGDNRVTIPYRVYYTNKFDRPVIVKLRWSLDLGGYKAHYNGGRAEMSVINRVEQVFKYVVSPLEGTTNLIFDENYQKTYANFNATSYVEAGPLVLENSVPGMSFSTTGVGMIAMEQGDILEVNGSQSTIGSSGSLGEKTLNIGSLGLKYKVEGGKLRLALNSWGVMESVKNIPIKVIRGTREISSHVFNIQAPKRIEGSSKITVREYYPVSTYINFNSVDLNSPVPLALENSVTDVTLDSSNQYGIVTMKQGDILEVNGSQSTIGSSGSLGEKTLSIGSLGLKYKVEGGKLRLALNSWGVMESVKNIPIKVIRNNNEISKHIISVKSPTKVNGTNNIEINNNYQIRNTIKFNGISLNAPASFSLESPIPQGVTLKEQTGYGIPLLEEGDVIQITDGITRGSYNFTVKAGGNLPNQRIELPNGSFDLIIENRKIQIKLNNWKVNEPLKLNLRAIRGTNEISYHNVTLTMPTAPFNIIKTEDLDFGTVLQGAKNKQAESNIRIKMIEGQDVSDIKFKLREEQPIMTNSNGDTLKVKKIDNIVQEVRDKEYNIKLRGTVDVPVDQKMGEYRGSNILDIEIK